MLYEVITLFLLLGEGSLYGEHALVIGEGELALVPAAGLGGLGVGSEGYL